MILLIPLGIIGVFILFWSFVALLFAIKEREERIGVFESYKKSFPKLLSFIWISILVASITSGGLLLLIIPGIVFAVWFSLAIYVLVSEDLKGMKALFRSKQLVQGYWWKVFWRFFFIYLIASLILSTPSIFQHLKIPFVIVFDILLYPLVIPFLIVFGFLLYENLRQIKEGTVFEEPKIGTKIVFLLIAILGFLVPVLLVLVSIIFSLSRLRTTTQENSIIFMMRSIQDFATFYYLKDRSYSKLSCDHPDVSYYCEKIFGMMKKKPVIYSSPEAYCAYIELPSGKYYCISSDSIIGTETTIPPNQKGYCDGITFLCPPAQ